MQCVLAIAFLNNKIKEKNSSILCHFSLDTTYLRLSKQLGTLKEKINELKSMRLFLLVLYIFFRKITYCFQTKVQNII